MELKSPLDKEDVPRNGNCALIVVASALTWSRPVAAP